VTRLGNLRQHIANQERAMVHLYEHESHDVDDQAQALDGWEQSYEQLGCGRFHGSVRQVMMDEGVLLRESTNRPLREEIAPPPDHAVLAVPMSVVPGSVFAGRPLLPSSFLVLMPGRQYDLVAAGGMDILGLTVHRDLLQTLEPSMADWFDGMGRRHSVTLGDSAAAGIRRLLLQSGDEALCLGELAAPREGQEAALLAAALAQAVGLAMCDDGAPQASSIPRRAHARLQVVRRAMEFMRANLQNDIGVPEICAAACASRRTLQYCFEEFLHTTPQAYLRALRLNEARRLLKLRGGQPITEIAGDLGFSSASHFTHHYKVMFDELPSETLKLGTYGTYGAGGV
jgi:AraC family ethanolamine operon transcriptional activator